MHTQFRFFVIICGIVLAVIYGLSSSPFPSGYADSDELITASVYHSVAHPPGFPLFISISHLGLKLLSILPPAQAANYLAGIYQAGAALFFFLLMRDMLRNHQKKYVNSIALAATGITAFSYHWWLYATVFEITSFSNLLTTGTMWCAYRWYNTATVANRWFWLTWLFAGLLLGHFQLAILLFPSLLILLLSKTKRLSLIVGGVCITIAVFGISNLLLFVQNQHRLPISWEFLDTNAGWIGHITRRDYTGFNPEVNTNFHTAFPIPSQFDQTSLISVGEYLHDLWGYFSPLGIFLALVGIISLWKKDRLLASIITIQFACTGPFLAAYMRLSLYAFEANLIKGMGERQFVINQLSVGLCIGFGIAALASIYRHHLPKKRAFLPYVLAVCCIGIEMYANRSLLTSHNSRQVAFQLAQTRLQQALPGSLIICTNDVDCYSLLYLSNVLKQRPDVDVLPHVAVYKTAYVAANPNIYPYADISLPDYFPQLIAWNIPRRSAVYLTSGTDFYPDYFGWETGPFYLEPINQLFKFTRTMPSLQPVPIPSYISSVSAYDARDKYGKGILETVANSYAYAGFLALKYQQVNIAAQYFQAALTIDPHNQQAKTMYDNRVDYAAKLKTIPIPNTVESYTKAASEQEKKGNNQVAENLFRQATYIDPMNESAIVALSTFYTRSNQPQLAAIYIQHLQTIQAYKKP